MTSATAMLVRPGEATVSGLTATISRDEVEAVLAADGGIDLMLDVLAPGESSPRRVELELDRDELAQLVAGLGGGITFAIDAADIERLLEEPDVEGHGLRERAAVLTVAVVAAAAGASSASAYMPAEGAGPTTASPAAVAVHDEMTLADRGIDTVAAVHDEATLAARGIEAGSLPSVHDEATLAARGIDTVAAVHDEATLAARGIEAGSLPSVHDEATLAARGIEAGSLPSVHDEATLAARGIETPAVALDEATLAVPGPHGTAPPVGSSVELPSVDAPSAAIVGGLAAAGLLIVGAGLAARRGPRPA